MTGATTERAAKAIKQMTDAFAEAKRREDEAKARFMRGLVAAWVAFKKANSGR